MEKQKEIERLKALTYTDIYYEMESLKNTITELNQALQLQQTGVNGSFFKCTCLHPQTNCFSGKCSYCNRTIVKDITTDDL